MSPSDNRSSAGADIIRQFFPTSPFVGHLGMQLTEMQPDVAVLTLPFAESLVTIGSTIHGGAIASLIDTAATVAAWSDNTVPENMRGTTVGLTVTYLAPAEGEDLRATARVLRRGGSPGYFPGESPRGVGASGFPGPAPCKNASVLHG